MYAGFSYTFVPVKNRMSRNEVGFADPYDLYYKMKNVYTWDALKRTDYFVDYQNLYTFCGVLSQRQIFVNVAKELVEAGQEEKALEILHMCEECVPEANFPLDMTYLGFSNEYWVTDMIIMYFTLGDDARACALARRFMAQLQNSKKFYEQFDELKHLYDTTNKYIKYMIGVCQDTIDEYLGYPEEHPFRAAAIRMFGAYSRCMSLKDWPDDSIWIKWFSQAAELDKGDLVKDAVQPYADNLIGYMGHYEAQRAEALTQQAKVEKSLESLENKYIATYSEYSELYEEYSADPNNSRVLRKLEKCQDKLMKYEDEYSEKLTQSEQYAETAEVMVEMFWSVVDNMVELYHLSKDEFNDPYAPKAIRNKLVEYWGEEAETLLVK